MARRTALRDNLIFQRAWRGGVHGSWRRWYLSPPVLAVSVCSGVGALWAFLISSEAFGDPGETLAFSGFALLAMSNFITTLAMISVCSRPLAWEWRRGRMLDLLMTPLRARELARGFFWGALGGWVIWLLFVFVFSGLLLFLALLHSEAGEEMLSVESLAMIASLYVYAIAQTIWAAGVTWSIATRTRSVLMCQLFAVLFLMLAAPILIFVFNMVVLFLLVATGPESGFLLYFIAGGGMWFFGGGLLFSLIKLAVGLILLWASRWSFEKRMKRLLEQTEGVSP